MTLVGALWKSYFGLVRDHFGQCAMEALLWATQGSVWRMCCGRATLGCRDHFGERAVEELLWASQGSLW